MLRPPSIPRDTDPEVFDLLVARWRSMAVAERVELIEQINADVETMALAGILSQRPGLTETELRFELTRRRYGDRLANAAYPHIDGRGNDRKYLRTTATAAGLADELTDALHSASQFDG